MADQNWARVWKSFPWGLIATLALVVAGEAFVAAHESDRFAAYLKESWRDSARAASGRAARADLLFFGDSLVKFGVSPPVIQAGTGQSAFNLAAYGGPPALASILLDRVAATGARPKAVVISFLPSNLTLPPRYYVLNWMLLANPRECLDLARTARDPGLFGEILLGRVFPSLRRRHEIRENLRLAFKGAGDPRASAKVQAERTLHWAREAGGELLPPGPPREIRADLADANLFPRAWSWDRAQRIYLRRFLDRAGSLGVRVYYLLPPLSPAVQSARETSGLDEHHTALLRSLQHQFPGLTVLDSRRGGYTDSFFFDTAHLNASGAQRLSMELAESLSPKPAGAGDRDTWRELRPSRSSPAQLSVLPDGKGRTIVR